MKKVIFALSMAGALIFGSASNTAVAQVEEGSMIVDLYYGFPNFGKNLWDAVAVDGEVGSSQATGLGPLGGRFEYMVADNFGVGVDVNFLTNGYEVSFTDTTSTYNSTTMQWETQTNTYETDYNKMKLRVMARLHYHFVQTDMVDAYACFGAGYKHTKNTFSTTDPDGLEQELETGLNLLPVSIRIGIGTRLFFTDNIGVNLELGAGGGPLMSAGLSLKF